MKSQKSRTHFWKLFAPRIETRKMHGSIQIFFSDWFHNSFVPFVQNALGEQGFEPKAKLDNCSLDGRICAEFLPPNTTSLIQPMDQGVFGMHVTALQEIGLARLDITRPVPMADFLKSINLLEVIERISLQWEQISPETIRRSWRKLLPIEEIATTSETEMVSNDFVAQFESLSIEISAPEIDEWFSMDGAGYEHLDEQGIVDLVNQQRMRPYQKTRMTQMLFSKFVNALYRTLKQ